MPIVETLTKIHFTDQELNRLHFIVESYAEIAPDEVMHDDALREAIGQAWYRTEAGQESIRAIDEIIEGIEAFVESGDPDD